MLLHRGAGVQLETPAFTIQLRMSQYPSPYTPPPYPTDLNYHPLWVSRSQALARRASILMMLLGGLLVGLSACFIGAGQLSKTASLPPELAPKMREIETQSGASFAQLAFGMGITVFVIAVLMIGLGVATRSGRKTPIILGIVASGTALLLVGILVVAASVQGIVSHNPENLIGACVWAVPGALAGLLLVWLIAALRAGPQADDQQNQYAAQYWQYQQNMQNYGGGYGYGAPQPPPEAGAHGRSDPPDPPDPPAV